MTGPCEFFGTAALGKRVTWPREILLATKLAIVITRVVARSGHVALQGINIIGDRTDSG